MVALLHPVYNKCIVNDRISQLESIVAHQENTLRELNAVVVEQADAITKLQKALQTITNWIQSEKERQSNLMPVDKPPHY